MPNEIENVRIEMAWQHKGTKTLHKQINLPSIMYEFRFCRTFYHISPYRGHSWRKTVVLQHNLPAITRFAGGLFEIRERFGCPWPVTSLDCF